MDFIRNILFGLCPTDAEWCWNYQFSTVCVQRSRGGVAVVASISSQLVVCITFSGLSHSLKRRHEVQCLRVRVDDDARLEFGRFSTSDIPADDSVSQLCHISVFVRTIACVLRERAVGRIS
jgi:hypothetical protein